MQPYCAENHSVFPKAFPYMLVFPKTKQTKTQQTKSLAMQENSKVIHL